MGAIDDAPALLALLEWLAADHDRLAALSPGDRERLHRAVARIYHPDGKARRQMLKAAERERSARRTERIDSVLQETGIRTLRRKPVFTTPNFFPPAEEEQPEARDTEAPEAHHCYVCKKHYSVIHHFYDQMCPECAEFNFGKRSELADLSGRVALLTGGRVKIGYQAGIKLLRAGAKADRHYAVSPRFGPALCAGDAISGSGAIGWGFSGWICAIRPAWKRFAGI